MLEITSVGAKVKYCWEATSGVRPTTGYVTLPDVNEAPEQGLSVETIDVSNITDYITRYAPGRQDPGGDQEFTLNHTDNVIDIWNALAAEAEIKRAEGKQLWFEYWFPGADKSYYWAGYPMALGTSGIAQNELDTIPAHVVLTDWAGWASHSAVLTLDKNSATIAASGNTTVTVSNATGTVSAVSSNTGVATVSVSGTTVTITGVAAGTCVVTVKDGNGDTAKVVVTVTAA